ncbi:lamin tail domain-containing protein [Rhodohalobacter sp. 8-1]|uniref:lamin tail domain-containing protein n=1 Tax=Rhodohalobacter sp. 8-1 TaxID=3131972 RepID=UPI0030ED167D
MKTCLITCILFSILIPAAVYPQTTVLIDTFEDQDLTNNPAWSGDLNDFSFDTESEPNNTLLRLDAKPDPTRTQIVTESSTVTGSWQFYVRQDFTPSNFNRAFIFLMADRADLNYLDGSSVSGYALRTGDNDSPRKFRLVRFDGGSQTELIESDTVIEEGIGYTIQVTRSEEGSWRLFVAPGRQVNPTAEGNSVTDQTYTESSYFGLLMRYSSGNVNSFFFDDFHIQNIDPFRMTGAEVISAADIELTFNYPVDFGSVQAANLTVTSLGKPLSAGPGSSEFSIHLNYPPIIPDGDYTAKVDGLKNVYGSDLPSSEEISFSFENPFTLLGAEITSSRSIELSFSLPPDPAATNQNDFIINQILRPNQLQFDSSRVSLLFDGDLPSGEITTQMNGLSSVDGWRLPDGISVSTYRFGDALNGDIVINEFLYRRANSGSPQFVEMFNLTDQTFNLSGWKLETDRGAADIPPGTTLDPSGYLLFMDVAGFHELNQEAVELPDIVPLRTTGDHIVLRHSDSRVIDSLAYEPSWGGNESGFSLERKDPSAISIDPVNWSTSMATNGSTPLRQNSQFRPDKMPPNLVFAAFQPASDNVLIRFDEFIDTAQYPEFYLNQRPAPVVETPGQSGDEFMIEAGEFSSNSEILVEIEEVADFQGNRSERLELPVARPLQPGDLVFNEIMFDPLSDDFDQLPNQSDYLELVNRRPYAISMEGVYIHDQPDENGDVRKIIPLSSRSKWIPAHGFAMVYPEDEIMPVDSSRAGRFFNLTSAENFRMLQAERTTLSLPLSGREIFLADSLGSVIDQVYYRQEWHNPNLIDTKGIALERIDPGGESTNAANWGSSTVPSGGTPLTENSLYQTPQLEPDKSNILLEPNPFSPDDDGHEDNLFISYSFEDPNYMLRVRIFDRHGRLVRKLAHSHPAGFEGSLTWNGRTDDRVTARIGIYIIHVEAFNSSNGDKKQFKEVAVLARQF